MEKEIKQVIVVEGKTDTLKLKKIFGSNLKTVETNGLRIDKNLFIFLNKINQEQGIIVLTDPDGPGKKIRDLINQNVTGKVLNAFITKKDMKQGSRKIGIAEAQEEAIIKSLENLFIFSSSQKDVLSWNEYLENNFYLKNNRQEIARKLGWSEELSSKTFFKWLNWCNLNVEKVKNILES